MTDYQEKLKTPIQYVKGVGPRKADILARLGIQTVEDLLFCFPRQHEDRSQIHAIQEVQVGERETIRGRIRSQGIRTTKSGIHTFYASIEDGTGKIQANWFNQPYLAKQMKAGDTLFLTGKVVRYSSLQIINPDFEKATGEGIQSPHMGRIVPMYRLTADLSQKALRKIMLAAIQHFVRLIPDPLTDKIKQRNRLSHLSAAVGNIHFPRSPRHLDAARRRLIFDEFFLLQLALIKKSYAERPDKIGIQQIADGSLFQEFTRQIPFKLTQAQIRVIREIETDLARERPMNRLVQGDVGTGKTILALYAILVAIRNGNQAALMVPTEILAEQHFLNLSRLLYPFNGRVAWLVKSLKPSQMRQTIEAIRQGEIDVVVGTQALIQKHIEFKKLGLIVIDEQHKFGVSQRAILGHKGKEPDCLTLTATPIPRTLALTLYGGLEISLLDEAPPGRGRVSTVWVNPENREEVYRLVREEVGQGHQTFIVYPAIKENPDIQGAEEAVKNLSSIFSDLKVGLLHGRLSTQEKGRVMQAFRKKKIQILVSTTIIEVGMDIPNASVMIVEHAERFGLSQLHQLRGRIGRSAIDAFCILIGDAKTEDAERRLQALVESDDGFQIAEQDLDIRGPGEFFGTRQHGIPAFRIANIVKDFALLEEAREEAKALNKEDPNLEKPEYAQLSRRLHDHYPLNEPHQVIN
jgi:ATP-dependent DNA helicase RecG